MEYSEKLDKIIYPVFNNYKEIILELEEKLEDRILLQIESNNQFFNYHFKCFKPTNNSSFNYLFYKYSTQSGFEFLEGNEQYSYLIKILYFEIQELLGAREIFLKINS